MTTRGDDWPPVRTGLVYLVCAVLLMVPLASTPVLPLIDFYNHIARYFVLSHVDGDPVLAANYAKAWALLPNLGLDAIATPLLAVVPPLLAAKLIVAFILLVEFGGVLFLHRALNRQADPLPAILLLGLLYSYILNWGFSNFLLGLGLVFWNLGLWFRLRDRPALATLVCSAGAVAIFFCHGFAFAIYGLLLGGIEFGRWHAAGTERRIGSLVPTMGLLAAQAVLPALLFLRMSTSQASGEAGSTVGSIEKHMGSGSLADRLDFEFWYRLRTIFRVAESPYPMLDGATFLISLGVIGWGWRKGWFRLHRWALPALALFVLLCVITPPSLFGVGYLSDRLPLVLAMLLIAALASARPLPKEARGAVAVLGAVALVRIAAMTVGWADYGRHYADFQAVTSVIPRGALVTDILPHGRDRRDGLLPRCQMYRPLMVPLKGDVVALFANPTQQPIRLKGEIALAQTHLGEKRDLRARPIPGYFDDQLAAVAAASHYDYILMCGRDRLTRPLPDSVSVVAEKGGITVLKVR